MTKKFKILRVLLRGERITSFDANRIGRTTEGARIIRRIRETYPVIKERVDGSRYYRYYLDPLFIKEYRAKNRMLRIWDNVRGVFV